MVIGLIQIKTCFNTQIHGRVKEFYKKRGIYINEASMFLDQMKLRKEQQQSM